MVASNLPYTKIKALAKIFGSCKFNSLLKIVRGLKLFNGCLFGSGNLIFETPNLGNLMILDLSQLVGNMLLSGSGLSQLSF